MYWIIEHKRLKPDGNSNICLSNNEFDFPWPISNGSFDGCQECCRQPNHVRFILEKHYRTWLAVFIPKRSFQRFSLLIFIWNWLNWSNAEGKMSTVASALTIAGSRTTGQSVRTQNGEWEEMVGPKQFSSATNISHPTNARGEVTAILFEKALRCETKADAIVGK